MSARSNLSRFKTYSWTIHWDNPDSRSLTPRSLCLHFASLKMHFSKRPLAEINPVKFLKRLPEATGISQRYTVKPPLETTWKLGPPDH